jgi:5S rRNA maturation endonuclease (ribonuclease M5)
MKNDAFIFNQLDGYNDAPREGKTESRGKPAPDEMSHRADEGKAVRKRLRNSLKGSGKMAKKQYRRLWAVVKRLILENYETLIKRSIRGSYYIVGDLLAPLIGKEITLEDYNWFGTEQGYASYRDEVWPKIEQEHGLQRPEAAAIGVVYEDGVEYPVTHLERVWDQARGFIFVEKADEAKDISDLSRFGWIVVAGKGYPLRLVRKLLKEDKRPVLVLHDYDPDGLGIYRALGFETRRTWHLDIALGDRVVDLGLTEKQASALNLPTRPSPPKYKGKPRVELSGLAVLATRMGLENPVLAYTVAMMLVKGYTLSPYEVPKKQLFERHLRWALTEGLRPLVNAIVDEAMKKIDVSGSAVTGSLEERDLKLTQWALDSGAYRVLMDVAFKLAEEIKWKTEEDYHKEALNLTSPELVKILSD